MLLTCCLTLMPVLCLQFEDQLALLQPLPSLPWPSHDEHLPRDIPEPEQVLPYAYASAQGSALGASCLTCSLSRLQSTCAAPAQHAKEI